MVPALDPVRMIEPPWPISGSAFWTVKIVPFTLVSKVSSMCSAVILPSAKRASRPGIGEDDVEGSALGLHRRVESVEVGLIRDRALHRAGIGPEVGHSGVERFLPAAEDEDEGALLDEALCRGAADAGSAAGDDGGLSIQSGPCRASFQASAFGRSGNAPETLEMGLPGSGVECGSAHIGGAKSIRLDD